MACVVALPTVRPLQECKILIDDILDTQEHVAESGAPHQRGQVIARGRDGGRHALNDVVDVGEPGVDDRLA